MKVDKDFLTKAVKIGTLTAMIFGFGVWSGAMWVTQNEFREWKNTAFAAVVTKSEANSRQWDRIRFYELDEIYINPRMELEPKQRDELCDLAIILDYTHELCRG